jgi:hypothetical protein
METINITGTEYHGNGVCQIRTVTVKPRWWRRTPRYILRVHRGWLGHWYQVYPSGKPTRATDKLAGVLDKQYIKMLDLIETERATTFKFGEARTVSRPIGPSPEETMTESLRREQLGN